MADKYPYNFEDEVTNETFKKKKNPAFLGLLIFLLVVGVLITLIFTVIVPILNKNLSNIGIKSVDEFISFYKEINAYVAESDVVSDPFGEEDYAEAYTVLMDSNLEIFTDDEKASDISGEKIEEYKEIGFPDFGSITLTGKELASLISNALKNENLIKEMDVEIIEKYKLSLEIKELTIKKQENLLDDEKDYFSFNAVGKVSLKEVAQSLPWPYNGMIPDNVYVTIKSTISYEDDSAIFSNCEIKINQISKETHQIIIDVINSQIKDKDLEQVMLDSLSEYLNSFIYGKIQNFAEMLSGKIRIVLNEENVAMFEISYTS